jgi:hypothetical protein
MNTSFWVIAGVVLAMGACQVAAIRDASGQIHPDKSFIMLSRAAWGCLRGQEITGDVSDKIVGDDTASATIYEIKNPEDVSNRYELNLLFAAAPINGLPGYFIFQFWCDTDRPEVKGFFSLKQAWLDRRDNQYRLSLNLKSNGFIYSRVLYSRKPEIRRAWFSCFEAGDPQPHALTFFSAYPLEGQLQGMPRDKLKGKWQILELRIEKATLDEAVNIDRCQAFLDLLDNRFAVSGRPLVWKRESILPESIRELFKQFQTGGQEKPFQVLLKADDRTRIQVGSDSFLPHLRQKLALENADGELTGAQLFLLSQ